MYIMLWMYCLSKIGYQVFGTAGFYSYTSGLLHWHMISPVPVKPSRWIWVNIPYESAENSRNNCNKGSTTIPCASSKYPWHCRWPEANEVVSWVSGLLAKFSYKFHITCFWYCQIFSVRQLKLWIPEAQIYWERIVSVLITSCSNARK